jgi:hypothetical protein
VNKQMRGAVIAAAVAGLFVAGHAVAAENGGGEAAKVKCVGGNACKGKGACQSADHSCAGENSCKGKGWIMTSSDADCKAKGGKPEAGTTK